MTVNETASDLTDEWAASWLRDTSKVGFILLLSVILVVACFGNMLVLAIAAKSPKMRTTNNCFIFNLAFCDFLVGCFSIPIMLTTMYTERWIFGTTMCKIGLVIDNLLMMESIWTLAALSVFRALSVLNPFRMKQRSVRKDVLIGLSILWVLVGCFVATPLLGWGPYSFSPVTFNCGIGFGTFFVSFVVLVLFLPISIVVVSYVIILYTLAVSNEINKRALHSTRCAHAEKAPSFRAGNGVAQRDALAISPGEERGTDEDKGSPKEKFNLGSKLKSFQSGPAKSSLRVLIIVGVFLICTGPILIIAFTMYVLGADGGEISKTTQFTVYILSLSHSAINPCVYGLFDKRFRVEYKSVFTRRRSFDRSFRSGLIRMGYDSSVNMKPLQVLQSPQLNNSSRVSENNLSLEKQTVCPPSP